ncbi:MAG TPA: DUF6427 family protein [Bacteroidales bacterium]|nr:DUF6427 family protein [Bacteroidales bacterium]HPR58637.1 DUF6427 family protein [Bacteroidales bacterium]HRW96461.1 DUF6427 family protein [Bacteroidales bacterium]
MIIGIFKSKYFGQYIGLLLLTFLLQIDAILNPAMFSEADPGFRFNLFENMVRQYPLVAAVVSAVLLLIQAFIFNQILENHRLTPLNQLLPAALYILMMSSNTALLQPNVMIPVNFMMILMLNILFNLYREPAGFSKMFDAGFLIGLASLLYLPAAWFLAFIWISLMIYQMFSLRAMLISLTGTIMPHFFLGFYFFWTGRLKSSLNNLFYNLIDVKILDFHPDVYDFIIWILFFLLFIYGASEVLKQITANTIEIRRKFRVLAFFFLFSIFTSIFAGSNLQFHLMLTLLPITAILSAYLSQTKKLFFPELIMSIILIAIFTEKFINLL